MKSENRLKDTKGTIENLKRKLVSYTEQEPVKIDPMQDLESQFNIWSYRETSNYPGNVN
jgi:hypothetical protein